MSTTGTVPADVERPSGAAGEPPGLVGGELDAARAEPDAFGDPVPAFGDPVRTDSGQGAAPRPPTRARERQATPRSSLTSDRIVAAGLGIADAEGLEAVSMRRVAAALGVGTMTLYTHVQDKDALLALMRDALFAEHLVTDLGPDWRTGLTRIARRTRECLLSHPWVLALGLRPALGPNKLRHIEQVLAAASGITSDTAAQRTIIHAVDDLVIGCATQELAAKALGADVPQPMCGLRRRIDADPALRGLLDSGVFPHLAQMLADDAPFAAERFEQALTWLLDGIERTYRDGT
ncbi:TetR family transcriptional regulator [Parafrankia colletiae]|uniref:TetR family transcriptional regulator n=1 Tax=Parafrankia colletiae TaxID=573497 RepID=A0A1S1QV40_9ACTN|nr:TetR/AcrR family transcriptional regulator C-terminal domain-containing protein [Parafrankia colletiae]MCK9901436.1 TetR/AcrR family transcriptional regulator C-terminal domain-containing protein [Frankia sp. Cpl3]OHV36284.1 TetR family transcriptional regulator [Parafrankia colletiae]